MDRLLSADPVAVALFAVGWCAGWWLLWRTRPLPPATGSRPAIAVVVPARDEAAALGGLVPALAGQLRPGDELVVVDDGSRDSTADVAARGGARVVASPPPPAGWLGKPHACALGAATTRAPVLLFVDADVTPAPDLLDRIGHCVANLDDDGPGVVSVQPWHRTGGHREQLGLLANVVALMGSGAFLAAPRVDAVGVAFGPVLAIRRERYERIGGHGAPSVRASPVEDIEIARLAGGAEVHGGRPDTTFRMYPEGLRQLVLGWSRTLAAGMRATPWWIALAVAAWMWSLAGGWLATPAVYPLSAVQLWLLGRRAGAMHPLTALVFPLSVVVLVVIAIRAIVVRSLRRPTPWKGRQITVR